MNSTVELSPHPRPPDDRLREKLADAVERLNASTDPLERVMLHTEITRLRKHLNVSVNPLQYDRPT